MNKQISAHTKAELIDILCRRYHNSSKPIKTQILNEFIAVSHFHRKYAIRLLNSVPGEDQRIQIRALRPGRRIYTEAMKEALIVLWEAADRICSKRLKAILPTLIEALERHGHMHLDSEVRHGLHQMSAATMDRLLSPIRRHSAQRKKKRKATKVSQAVPVRTFSDWHDPLPGFLEIDFVAHGGESMAGSFIHTLVATDICSGWTECLPLLAREQSLVVEGLEVLFGQLPFSVKGIDSDNDGAFINDTLWDYCAKQHIEFTRSRAYCKNDQAWIEQKNGAVVEWLGMPGIRVSWPGKHWAICIKLLASM